MAILSGTEINLFFKWDTAGGANRSFRIGTPLSLYSLSSSDELVLVGQYLNINIPTGNVVESGSGTIVSDSGSGYIRIKTATTDENYAILIANFATSAPRVNVTARIDPIPVKKILYGP